MVAGPKQGKMAAKPWKKLNRWTKEAVPDHPNEKWKFVNFSSQLDELLSVKLHLYLNFLFFAFLRVVKTGTRSWKLSNPLRVNPFTGACASQEIFETQTIPYFRGMCQIPSGRNLSIRVSQTRVKFNNFFVLQRRKNSSKVFLEGKNGNGIKYAVRNRNLIFIALWISWSWWRMHQ